MIGIGITTYNRREVFLNTLEHIKKYAPKNSKIVVVDDGSNIPYQDADFRFETNQGSPIAKNKCFELLDDCEHIFLFDDDIYPISKHWYKPYINSKEPHLNYTFKCIVDIWNEHKVFDNPNGCMMYYQNIVLEKVGGFDTGFYKYGYWHGSMSCRIYNAGLTSFPFMDVMGSEKLFYSLDEHRKVSSATSKQQDFLPKNKKRYFDKLGSSEFIPYKKTGFKIRYSNPFSTEKNIGKALNEFCEIVPENDWICLQDGDMFYLTPDWGNQINEVIKRHGDKYSLFGCMTNRLARQTQRLKSKVDDNHNTIDHYHTAQELKQKHWGEVKELHRSEYIAGLFMLFPKSLWNEVKFRENDIAFDDSFCKDIKRKGHKLAVMTGLYVYHFYRGWSDTPVGDRKHLL